MNLPLFLNWLCFTILAVLWLSLLYVHLNKELSEQPVSLETSFCVLLYFVRVSMITHWTTFKSTVCPAWLRNLLNQTNVANLSAIPRASNTEYIHKILIFTIHKWNIATIKYSNRNKNLATCKMLQGFHIQYVATRETVELFRWRVVKVLRLLPSCCWVGAARCWSWDSSDLVNPSVQGAGTSCTRQCNETQM